jgi:hypothetical protein
MASIDHTQLVWKNGIFLPNVDFDQLPFEYGRDGDIYKVRDPFGTLVNIEDAIKWYRDEYDALYQRSGIRQIYHRWNGWSIGNWLKWKFRCMNLVHYMTEVGVYKCDDIELYIYHDATRQSYASFYKNGTDTYIVLGGYGHRENVYCHFMNRGYGEEFEMKMASEAFQWLCERVLQYIAESMTDHFDEEDELLDRLQSMFDPDYVKTWGKE